MTPSLARSLAAVVRAFELGLLTAAEARATLYGIANAWVRS